MVFEHKITYLVFIAHSQFSVKESYNNWLPTFSTLTFHIHFALCFLLVYFVLNQRLSTFPIASISLASSMLRSSIITMWQVEQGTAPVTLKSNSSHRWLPAGVSVFKQMLELKINTWLKPNAFFTQVSDTAIFILHFGCTDSKCLFDISFTIYNFFIIRLL